jgi:hypothetical protein
MVFKGLGSIFKISLMSNLLKSRLIQDSIELLAYVLLQITTYEAVFIFLFGLASTAASSSVSSLGRFAGAKKFLIDIVWVLVTLIKLNCGILSLRFLFCLCTYQIPGKIAGFFPRNSAAGVPRNLRVHNQSFYPPSLPRDAS